MTQKTKKQILTDAGYIPVRGRPPVGSVKLNCLTIPEELNEALEIKAFELGVSFPEVRRLAYLKFITEVQAP